VRPEENASEQDNELRLNIYLVQVDFEPTMRNNDLPTRDQNGHLVQVPEVPLVLRYLFSYFGPEEKAQEVLGATEIELHSNPFLAPADINAAVEAHGHLQGSGLDVQQPPVRIVPSPMSLEQLSRFWSGFFHSPYTLSTLYDIAPVIMKKEQPTIAPGPPVARGAARTAATMPPQLDPLPAVTYGAEVPVMGPGVSAGQYAGVDGHWSRIETAKDGLAFKLPTGVSAGTHAVTLGAQPSRAHANPEPIPGSRPQELLVRPDLKRISKFDHSARLRVRIEPHPLPTQEVALDLRSTALSGTQAGQSVRLPQAVPTQSGSIEFEVPGSLPPGRYFGIVEVDGVASLPTAIDGLYASPWVKLP
jgi:hypothetical protein